MTTTSITAGPVDATLTGLGAVAGADASVPNGAGDFLAAILQALAPHGGAVATTGMSTDAVAADPAGDQIGDETADPGALGLVVPPGLAGQLAAVVPVLAPGHANVAEEAGAGPTDTSGDIRMPGDAAPVPRTPAHATGPARLDPSPFSGTAEPSDRPAATTDDAGPALPTGLQPVEESAGPVTTQPAVTVAAASPATAPTVSSGAGDAAPVQHVARHVFPEVTSLVSNGNGTHRITLSLRPEALGEVRVVMTVRDGTVHVRFAAGHEASRALLEGSPELNRLLELAGASESRVVVRDLGGSQTSAQAATTAGAGPDLSQGLGTGDHRPQDQHAGTRADNPAMDGAQETARSTRASGADRPRSIEPDTRTRSTGVDVTM